MPVTESAVETNDVRTFPDTQSSVSNVELVELSGVRPPSTLFDKNVLVDDGKVRISTLRHNLSYFVFPITLSSKTTTYAMIDSGATRNFINKSLVLDSDFVTEKLAVPLGLDVVDGRPISSG